MDMQLKWLGNAGFEIGMGKSILLVDPFLTRPKWWQVYCGRVHPHLEAIQAHIHRCDHILISHTHFDHFMDAPAIAQQTGAVVYGSTNTCELSRQMGIPATQRRLIHTDEGFRLDNLSVQTIPAAHPWIPGYGSGAIRERLRMPLHLQDYRMDTNLSFLIKGRGLSVLIWSSTHTQGAVPADVLICRAVSDRDWYRRLLETVRPQVVIPSHWDDFFTPLTEAVKPFFSPPRFAFVPIQRIHIKEFELKIKSIFPHCSVLIPERFNAYSIQ